MPWIQTQEELDALPNYSTIVDDAGIATKRNGAWYYDSHGFWEPALPVRLLDRYEVGEG